MIFIGFKCWTRIGYRIDHPEILYFPVIRPDCSKFFWIRRKYDVGTLSFVFVFLLVNVGLSPVRYSVAVMFNTIGCNLLLYYSRIFFLLLSLLIIFGIHPIKVMMFWKDNVFLVRCNWSPFFLFQRLFKIIEHFQHSCRKIVFKMPYLSNHLFLFRVLFLKLFLIFLFFAVFIIIILILFLFLNKFAWYLELQNSFIFDEF